MACTSSGQRFFYLKVHAKRHSKKYYYYLRDEAKPTSLAGQAARFLYLNRTCWNGLDRVNLKGKFNVPKGTKSKVILDTDDFEAAAKALGAATLVCSDFATIVDMAEKGDLIYADPPYTVHHNMNGFIKYNEVLFSWEDQTRLRDCLLRASERGAHRCCVECEPSLNSEALLEGGQVARIGSSFDHFGKGRWAKGDV
jgi:DNA adenine methylase